MDNTKPLGSITVEGARYELTADGTWTGPPGLTLETLATMFHPRHHSTESAVVCPPGSECIRAAAKFFGDPSPELPQWGPSAPGTIH